MITGALSRREVGAPVGVEEDRDQKADRLEDDERAGGVGDPAEQREAPSDVADELRPGYRS